MPRKQPAEDAAAALAPAAAAVPAVALPPLELPSKGGPLPVVLAFAPRETGATTMLGSLVADLGVDAALVLTDRGGASYMGALVPPELVVDAPLDATLAALVNAQRLALQVTGRTSRVLLAVDDALYRDRDRRMLAGAELQSNLKQAGELGVAVVIVTSDAELYPPNVPTFATVTLATRVGASELKPLKRRLFNHVPEDILESCFAACGKFQFLAAKLRGCASAEASLRVYHPRPASPDTWRPCPDAVAFLVKNVVQALPMGKRHGGVVTGSRRAAAAAAAPAQPKPVQAAVAVAASCGAGGGSPADIGGACELPTPM